MDPLCSSFGKGIVLPFLASLAFIGITVNAGIKGSFKCTPPPPLTCETNHLPYVGNGSFDCPPDSKVSLGNTCNLNCKVGFYPASNQAVCKVGIGGGQRGSWSQGNFTCNAYGGGTDGLTGEETDGPNSEGTDGPNGGEKYGTNGVGTNATNGGGTDGNGGGSDVAYGGETDGPNGLRTDDPNSGGTDATNGGGTDATNGAVTDGPNGEGTDGPNGEGTYATNGGGTDATNGGGTDATNGDGTDATNGGGTDATNGEGTDATNGGGTDTTNSGGTDGNGGGSDEVITCEKGALPEVHNGSFDCPGQISLNNTCNLTCDVGFYPVSANTTTCEPGVTGHPIGSWSRGTFDCHDCSGQWDGSIYRFYVINMTHANATDKCQGVGSAIAYIESSEENFFVHKLVKKCAPDNGQWAGWTWIDADISNTTGYTNRDAGETTATNAQCMKEECWSMKYDSGKWHDHCCNREFYPVCEQKM